MTEYVTVVSVDMEAVQKDHEKKNYLDMNKHKVDHKNQQQHIDQHKSSPSPFVTVLKINNNGSDSYERPANGDSGNSGMCNEAEVVVVYRLPGERLGFGLKFLGGTKTDENIQRLFIQSCAADSPASRARASWGPLTEGDEIVEIDGEKVTKMTRIECVKCLKNNNLAINLLVKKGAFDGGGFTSENLEIGINGSVKKRLPPEPPKVPPRKINKKSNGDFHTGTAPVIVAVTTNANVNLPISLPPEVPVAAEMYLNTLDDEISHHGNESDETGSTISTVISNFSSETDLTNINMVSMGPTTTNELTKMLTKPFQLIEKEFGTVNNNKNHIKITDAEPYDILHGEKAKLDVKNSHGSYELDVPDPPPRQYENVSVVPPVPRPRTASLTNSNNNTANLQSNQNEKSPKTKTITIETWLKDANKTTSINGDESKAVPVAKSNNNFERNYRRSHLSDLFVTEKNNNKLEIENKNLDNDGVPDNDSMSQDDVSSNSSSSGDVEKVYEPIKFECFASTPDDADDQLGPPELLNISEAYFNFPWSSSTSLPTIGEAEEDGSLEPQQHHFVQKMSVVNNG